jgi:hypothetical protein
VGNKSRNEAIFLSEQPFTTLNDEIVPLMKNFSLNPLEKKKKIIFSLLMKLIWITMICSSLLQKF